MRAINVILTPCWPFKPKGDAMSTLKKLSDVSYEQLPLTEKLAYLNNSLTTVAPAFHQAEPDLKKNRLFNNLATKPVRCWFIVAFILSALIAAVKEAHAISMTAAIILWSIVALLLIVYFIFKKKVDGYFIRYNDKLTAKFTEEHESKLDTYHAELSHHQAELDEYNARELTYEQAAQTVEQAIHYHGVRFCRTLLGVDETELIALHILSAPVREKLSKSYGEQAVSASHQVQYICMTDTELYEMNGELDLLSGEMTNYDTARVLYSRIKNAEERQNQYNCLNFFAITTSNYDGSESDVMYIPSGNLRPQVHYYIQSVTWAPLSKDALLYAQTKEARKAVNSYIQTPLYYDKFQEVVKYIQNYNCLNYESYKQMTETQADIDNYKTVKQVVERAVNRMIRESSM
ncbi:hypothetical protein WMW72_14150 [Paenibacillus filicis]|uniref:Uncharacterized protein n=1 Tax=Paenibacillus filicis TaxID=669464 RepID=A0ABU9DLE9_9BACL